MENSNLDIIESLLKLEEEYCGFVESDKTLTINSKGSKGSCQHTHYTSKIWHTHPYISKAYPSVQDVLKILKHKSINISYIFTVWGIYIISCSDRKEINEILQKDITHYIDSIYFKLHKGRDILKEEEIPILNSILNKLNEKINLHGFAVSIKFIPRKQ